MVKVFKVYSILKPNTIYRKATSGEKCKSNKKERKKSSWEIATDWKAIEGWWEAVDRASKEIHSPIV